MARGPGIAVIGAGIGGLTAAALLARDGWDVAVYEQSVGLGEVGAGLTLSTGAQAVLREAGVLPAVVNAAMVSASVPFLHYRTGALLAGSHDGGEGIAVPDAAPVARQMHRADLHAILAAGVRGCGVVLHLDHRLADLRGDGDGVELMFANGRRVRAGIAIGADGLHSAVRGALFGEARPRFTGQVAWRCLIPVELAHAHLGAGRAAVYFGPGCVLNRYTLRRGTLVNCVALSRTRDWVEDGWSVAGDREAMLTLFHGWHADVRGLLAHAPTETLRRWGLFDREPLPVWRRGHVTLLGDAAHPMLPFLGLGAAMAIEDAMTLSRCLALPGAPLAALDRYEQLRRPRVTAIWRASARQGALLQELDPERYEHRAAPAGDRDLFAFDPVAAPLEPVESA